MAAGGRFQIGEGGGALGAASGGDVEAQRQARRPVHLPIDDHVRVQPRGGGFHRLLPLRRRAERGADRGALLPGAHAIVPDRYALVGGGGGGEGAVFALQGFCHLAAPACGARGGAHRALLPLAKGSHRHVEGVVRHARGHERPPRQQGQQQRQEEQQGPQPERENEALDLDDVLADGHPARPLANLPDYHIAGRGVGWGRGNGCHAAFLLGGGG